VSKNSKRSGKGISATKQVNNLRNDAMKALLSCYSRRPDLQNAFPEAKDGSYDKLLEWCLRSGLQVDSAKYELLPYWEVYSEIMPGILDDKQISALRLELEFLRNPKSYEFFWKKNQSLDMLNKTMHDGFPLDKLYDRAKGYCSMMFDVLFPHTQPKPGSRVLEFGSGVGWLMQAMLDRFQIAEIVGLDISDNIVLRARERWYDPRAKFIVYSGLRFPIPDDYFDTIFSVSTLQHIEKHVAFLLLNELYRVLKPGGNAILQFLSIHHLPFEFKPYSSECMNHITNSLETSLIYYYSFDELYVIFHDILKVDDLDIQYKNRNFYVSFSKGTGRRIRNERLQSLTFTSRLEAPENANKTTGEQKSNVDPQ
jgi:ubiquinone/menaquinone biosynthesis C-methylase UbiE